CSSDLALRPAAGLRHARSLAPSGATDFAVPARPRSGRAQRCLGPAPSARIAAPHPVHTRRRRFANHGEHAPSPKRSVPHHTPRTASTRPHPSAPYPTTRPAPRARARTHSLRPPPLPPHSPRATTPPPRRARPLPPPLRTPPHAPHGEHAPSPKRSVPHHTPRTASTRPHPSAPYPTTRPGACTGRVPPSLFQYPVAHLFQC